MSKNDLTHELNAKLTCECHTIALDFVHTQSAYASNLGKKNRMTTDTKAAIVQIESDKFAFLHVECFDSFACGEPADVATLKFTDIVCDLCGNRLADDFREMNIDEFESICEVRQSTVRASGNVVTVDLRVSSVN